MRPIDIHVHPGTQAYVDTHGKAHEKIEKFFGKKSKVWGEEELGAFYVEQGVQGVLLAFDAESATGAPRTTNDYVADLVQRFPDAFVCGFASVDPWKGEYAVAELERSARELGLKGVKFHPSVQAFYPNDRRFDPMWEKCQELRLPVLLHSGLTGWPDVPMEFSKPIPYLDDLALRFPDLTIISAHPAYPWVDEQIALALMRPNIYLDLSGYLPKYFPPQLARDVNSRLQNKVLFGTDFPSITPERWIADFDTIDLKPGVREKVLYGNAARILGLAEPSA